MNPWVRIVINLLGYDIAWTACILGAARGYPWIGVGIAVCTLAVHLAMSPCRRPEAALLVVGAILGVGIDVAMSSSGVYAYTGSGSTAAYLAAFFLLWLNFGTTLRVALRWAWRRLWAGALLGLAGGPLAYWGAAQLGAVTLGEPVWVALATVAAAYGLATPLWLLAARRVLKGCDRAPVPRESAT